MVNGRISIIVYVGAWLTIMLYMIGTISLAWAEKPLPNELDKVVYVALGIVGGSHIMPPIKRAATLSTLRKVETDLGVVEDREARG